MYRLTILSLIITISFCSGQNGKTTFLYSDTVLFTGQTHLSTYNRPLSAVEPSFVIINKELVDSIFTFLQSNPTITVDIETYTTTWDDPLCATLISRGLTTELKWRGIPDNQYRVILKGNKDPIYDNGYLNTIKDKATRIKFDNFNYRFRLKITKT